MQKLTAAKLYRAGRTGRSWNHESNEVKLGTVKEQAIRLNFNLSSKGGGITEVQLELGAQDFSAIVAATLRADRSAGMQVIAAALAGEVVKQPEYDLATIRKARESVHEAAYKAYTEAPSGKDHAERLTSDMVEQLVAQLNAANQTASDHQTKAA